MKDIVKIFHKCRRAYPPHSKAKVEKLRKDAAGNVIEWHLTLEQFKELWKDPHHWANRRIGGYCLARTNDLGHYEIGNVRVATWRENMNEARPRYEKKRNEKATSREARMSAAKKIRVKISEETAKEIVLLVKSGLTQATVADAYGISQMTVSNMCTGNWAPFCRGTGEVLPATATSRKKRAKCLQTFV